MHPCERHAPARWRHHGTLILLVLNSVHWSPARLTSPTVDMAAQFRFTKPNMLVPAERTVTIRVQLRNVGSAQTQSNTQHEVSLSVNRPRFLTAQNGTSKKKRKNVYPHHHFVLRPHTAYCDIITFIKHYLLIPRYRKEKLIFV